MQPADLLVGRWRDFDHDVGVPWVVDGGAGLDEQLVGHQRAYPGAGLDDDLQSPPGQLLHHFGHQSNPALAVSRFPGNTDPDALLVLR